MKFNVILLATIFLISCKGKSQKIGQQQAIEENWQIAQVVTQKHSYNKSGLLDTTHKIQNIYVNGELGVVFNLLVTRDYDTKNNIVKERTFQVFKKNNKLSEEVLFQYDTKNNLVLKTEKSDNIISKITKYTYNDKNKRIKEIEIRKSFEDIPKNWNLDSAVAHHDDKKNLRYDTSLIIYNYDISGNQINKIYSNSNRGVIETVTTVFTGNQKTLTIGINSKGDTVSITSYKQKGKFVTEINHDKNNLLFSNTSLYDGDRLIEAVFIDKRTNFNTKDTYRYDTRGNEIESISYK